VSLSTLQVSSLPIPTIPAILQLTQHIQEYPWQKNLSVWTFRELSAACEHRKQSVRSSMCTQLDSPGSSVLSGCKLLDKTVNNKSRSSSSWPIRLCMLSHPAMQCRLEKATDCSALSNRTLHETPKHTDAQTLSTHTSHMSSCLS
jgi:hypothetical protein